MTKSTKFTLYLALCCPHVDPLTKFCTSVSLVQFLSEFRRVIRHLMSHICCLLVAGWWLVVVGGLASWWLRLVVVWWSFGDVVLCALVLGA